jgi:alpha-N-arabinofuranosidase
MTGPRKMIVNGGVDIAKKPIWIEAPHILKVDGRYYLICAEGGTADQHSEVVFRGDSVGGPYVPYSRNPILTQRHLSPTRPPRSRPLATRTLFRRPAVSGGRSSSASGPTARI